MFHCPLQVKNWPRKEIAGSGFVKTLKDKLAQRKCLKLSCAGAKGKGGKGAAAFAAAAAKAMVVNPMRVRANRPMHTDRWAHRHQRGLALTLARGTA